MYISEERRPENVTRAGNVATVAAAAEVVEQEANAAAAGGVGAVGGAGGPGWGRRHTLIDNTPPTTPDSSLDLSPHRYSIHYSE